MLLFPILILAQTDYPKLNYEINNGNFSEANKIIDIYLDDPRLSEDQKDLLKFEKERLERIKKDFKLTQTDVLDYIKKFIPEANENMLYKWESDGSLEIKVINGEKKYFNRSHTNLFRINKEAKERKKAITLETKDGLDLLLENLVPQILSDIDSGYGMPQKIKLKYTITVEKNIVPPGATLRCWIPYPREGNERQNIVEFHTDDKSIIADNNNLQRSIYFEKKVEKDTPTKFSYELVLLNKAYISNINKDLIKPYQKDSDLFIEYTSERKPHIVFTDKIKSLSKNIIGNETNPFLKAKLIFEWISNNIPWAGAREYSTIENISDYCLTNMHGDCGIKTLLFMTLARYNGIPTKWQSGWMLHPGEKNLHDWCEAYFEGYGWVPVDQSFGIIDSDNESVKYFYLGNIDQYRFIVNDDYSKPFYPTKNFPRSETVDFQRGEVEWEGGNLYFDQWDYSMEVEYLD
ncbi:MAG: transglutaminase domain-containing protein [Ignavibacteriales bacterium]|nr:transglutaminase domain-containing protein [Ignavibacteriales bacterium]